jgi:hypothetical protein
MKLISLWLVCAVGLLLSACSGPSEEECRAACEEAASECTDPAVMEKCVDRCEENADSEQVERAKDNCKNPFTCSSGLCCAGFYYDEAGRERNCS